MPDSVQDGEIHWVPIDDFSAGIVRYGINSTFFNTEGPNFIISGVPVTYTPNAPIGSASSAFRCINKPGVGLVPFASYAVPQGMLPFVFPVFDPATDFSYSVGMETQMVGPEAGDMLAIAVAYSGVQGGTEVMKTSIAFWPNAEAVPPGNTPTPPVFLGSHSPNLGGISFTRTRTTYTAGILNLLLGPQIWYSVSGGGVFAIPDWNNESPQMQITFPETNYPIAFLHAHTERVLVCSVIANGSYDNAHGVVSSAAEDIYFTVPQGITFDPNSPNEYTTVDFSGYGAWGTIATGELFLVKASGGGVVVSGDPGYPSSSIFIAGVKGTGAICGKGIPCQTGLVYLTETDGAYLWNGSNTSEKVSAQIPDTDLIRKDLVELASGSVVQSISTFHDYLGNLVFWANNYIYDSLNNSWWQSEDPDAHNFGCFAHSVFHSDSKMWALEQNPGRVVSPYLFDTLIPQNSYEWTSNPIPAAGPGLLSHLAAVEVVVSNPTPRDALVTLQPTVPAGQTPYLNQNPAQAIAFRIPAFSVAWRGRANFGYEDFNIQISVKATNMGTQPAPIIHSINLGFKPTNTSDFSPSVQNTEQFWIVDDPTYGLADLTTIAS